MTGDGWHQFFLWCLAHWTWVFWVVVGLVAVRMAFRWFRVFGNRSKCLPGSPEEILRLRYSSGEIDKKEYERRLSELRRLRGGA